MIVISS